MAKSMADRMGKIDASKKYADVLEDHSELKKNGRFKPDLKPLCAKYDSNKKAYEPLAQRKKNISVYLDQLLATKKTYESECASVEEQRQKVNKENDKAIDEVSSKLGGEMKKEDNADMSVMLSLLRDYTDKVKAYLDLNNAHRNKEEKLDNQHVVNLKKICDSYEKESKSIQSAIDKLETEETNLESQIRKVVLSYQKTAVDIDNKKLETDLNKVLAAFP